LIQVRLFHFILLKRTYFLEINYTDIFRSLLFVKNESFRNRFKQRFEQRFLTDHSQLLYSTIIGHNNLLHSLMGFDKQSNHSSLLTADSIELICGKIDVGETDLLNDAFDHPTRSSSTYQILFENFWNDCPLRTKVIERLSVFWREWEKNGFSVSQFKTWKMHESDEKLIIIDVWKLIAKNVGTSMRLVKLIYQMYDIARELDEIMEKVLICVNFWYITVLNEPHYLYAADHMTWQNEETTLYMLQILDKVKKFEPSIDFIQSLCQCQSHAWKRFLTHHQTSKTRNQSKTCLTILEHLGPMVDEFTRHLKIVCDQENYQFHVILKTLFPTKDGLDDELRTLKVLLNQDEALKLEYALDSWKNQLNNIRICQNYIYLMKQCHILKLDSTLIFTKIIDSDETTPARICAPIYQEYFGRYSKEYGESMQKLTNQWDSWMQLLDFLLSLTSANVEDLLEAVDEWDETMINTKTVLDFVLLKRYFTQVDNKIDDLREKQQLKLRDITRCFEAVLYEDDFKNILNCIDSCVESVLTIKRVHKDASDRGQSKRQRILDIMKNSQFCFRVCSSRTQTDDVRYGFDIQTMHSQGPSTSIDDLLNLRDRARLIQYANTSKTSLQDEADDSVRQLQAFVCFVETITLLLDDLQSLDAAGYPIVQEYLRSQQEFTCLDGNYDDLNRLRVRVTEQKNDWENQLAIHYQQCPDLTYFSYQQLWMMETYLYCQKSEHIDHPEYHFLRFIGIDATTIQFQTLPARSQAPVDCLNNVAQIFSAHHPPLEDRSTLFKIFLVETSDRGILRAIYSLFNLNQSPILANRLFYCRIETHWTEVRAFIYRCFYSQTLHQLIRPELLPTATQDKATKLFTQLMQQQPKHSFCLGIITTVSQNQLHFVSGLKTHPSFQNIHDQELLDDEILDDLIQSSVKDCCMLVTSRIAGLGKTTFIRNQIRRLNKQYVKFPIHGDMIVTTLAERLRGLGIQSNPSTIALHIDIGPVENVQQLNEFLYSLVLFRCFRLSQIPVYLPADIPIYIELDASRYLSTLEESIVVSKYLNHQYFESMDWNELNVIDSRAIQFVANYLQAINDRTIITKHINYDTMVNLDQPSCIDVLKKYFLSKKDENLISWTQLSIFVEVYNRLFLGFSQCGYFLPDSDLQSSLRRDILLCLLESSNQFTSLSVQAVRQSQNAMDDTSVDVSYSEGILRWDRTQHFTMIFAEDDQPIFVHRRVSDIPDTLRHAFDSYFHLINTRTVITKTQKRGFLAWIRRLFSISTEITTESEITVCIDDCQKLLRDHDSMDHEHFFLRLTSLSKKYSTQSSICKECLKQYTYTEQRCTSCDGENLIRSPSMTKREDVEAFQKEIAAALKKKYVLTADNYFKMLLIYLRVQSGLPVLIMGETGT
jgi:hypothetical protein